MKTIKDQLDNIAAAIWKKQESFIQSGLTPKEETITDELYLVIKGLNSPNFNISLLNKRQEGRDGADFDLWIGSDTDGYRRYCVQAKILDTGKNNYPSLFKKTNQKYQYEYLKEYSIRSRSEPLYLFYNFIENPDFDRVWRCCEEKNLFSFGCSFTRLINIERLRVNKGRKTFNSIHCDYNGEPIKCIACMTVLSREDVMEYIPPSEMLVADEDYDNFYKHIPNILDHRSDSLTKNVADQIYGDPKYRLIVKLD